jgi:hypothetical protein
MNVAEACITDLRSCIAVYLIMKERNKHLRWLHVSPEAEAKIRVEVRQIKKEPPLFLAYWLQISCMGFTFNQDSIRHSVAITKRRDTAVSGQRRWEACHVEPVEAYHTR